MIDLARRLYDLYEYPIISRDELKEGLLYLGAQALSPFRAAGAAAVRSVLYLRVELSSALYGPAAQLASGTRAVLTAEEGTAAEGVELEATTLELTGAVHSLRDTIAADLAHLPADPTVFPPDDGTGLLLRALAEDAARLRGSRLVVDLGCGSGCVAAQLARALPGAAVRATEEPSSYGARTQPLHLSAPGRCWRRT